MTSAVISPETKDTPSLTVTISQLSSSSPFPSPGSPFLPPPIPSAHEYALVAPVSKRRSTDSRMNVGSKTDHELAASTPHNPVVATTAGKTSSTFGVKQKESANIITNGSSNSGNGLADSFSCTLVEPAKPDSKATVGQPTPLLNSAGAELSIPSHGDALNANSSRRSTPPDDDAGENAGGTSVSPSTPSPSSPSSHNPPAADPRCSTTPATTPSLSPISTTITTTTEDVARPSPDNNPKSPSRSTSLRAPRDSLTSSRPAPLSPANSRRASKALSRHSSTSARSSRSRPGSISSLTPTNPTHNTEVLSPTTPTPIQQQTQQQQQQQATRRTSTPSAVAPPHPILVKIRDFAFSDEDVRHTGTGPLTPRPNRRVQRPLSTWSASSASSGGSEDYRDDGPGASGGSNSFGFSGWGLGRLGWFGARTPVGSASGANVNANSGDGPSQGDFARNFTDATGVDYEIEDPYDSLDEDEDDDVDEGQGVEEANSERPLLPGLYRALYAFEPEGTAEMALEEDQIVRVIGRGGGVGWAIVARNGNEGHALVPEGYLDPVNLDQDQVGEEEG